MKKLLIASTALTLSAGFAAAEVKVGGFGFAGVASYGGDTYAETGIRLEFTGTTTTSAGTSLEAYVRAEFWNTSEFGGSPWSSWEVNRQRIKITHDNLSLALGSTHGALNTLAHHEVGGGYNDWWVFYASNSNSNQWDGGTNALLRYDVGAFSIAASSNLSGYDQEVAVQYSANGLTFGAGVGTLGNWMAKVGYETGGLTLGAGINNDGTTTASIGYAMGDWDASLSGVSYNWGSSGYGLDVGYSLGGGVRLSATAAQFSWGQTNIGAGVMFNF